MSVAAVALLACTASSSQREKAVDAGAALEEAKAPAFDSAHYRPSSDELRDIAKSIDELTQIDALDLPTNRATFLPHLESGWFENGFIGVDHGTRVSSAAEHLVALGPKALPPLLAALSDPTPTRLVVEHKGFFGGLWYARELWPNAWNERDRATRTANAEFFERAVRLDDGGDTVERHAVTRGDIAFVLVGEICNRAYACTRYQPTACRVVNSPTHDAQLATIVRAMWSSDDPARMLYDSLTTEFALAYDPNSLDGIADTDAWQLIGIGATAAQRLAYYFPSESSERLARALDAVTREPGRSREEALVAPLAHSDDPRIVDAMRRLVERTPSVATFRAALTATFARNNAELVTKRIRAFLADRAALPSAWNAELLLLEDAATYIPDLAEPIFADYVRRPSWEARDVAVRALSAVRGPISWVPALLTPLLDDRRDASFDYGPTYDRQPLLICDEAAVAIVAHSPGASFRVEGERSDLDAQIAELKRPSSLARASVAPHPIDFSQLPIVRPARTVHVSRRIQAILPRSDASTLVALFGFSGGGSELDVVEIDTTNGQVCSQHELESRPGSIRMPRSNLNTRLCTFDNEEGDRHVVVRDLDHPRVTSRSPISTQQSFTQLPAFDWRKYSLSSDERWVFAMNSASALEAMNIESGKRETLCARPANWNDSTHQQDTIVPNTRTNDVLLQSGGNDVPIAVWHHDTRQLETIAKVPSYGWSSFVGPYAVNEMNHVFTVWNLKTRRLLVLPLPPQPEVDIFESIGIDGPRIVGEFDATLSTLVVSTPQGVFVLDLIEHRPLVRLELPETHPYRTFVFSADGKWLFCSSRSTSAFQDACAPEGTTPVAIFEVAQFTR